MSILKVGSGEAYKTLSAAGLVAVPGDVVEIYDGVYHEVLKCTTAGVTWKAADGQKPVIDGRWDGTPQKGVLNQITCQANGVIVDGLTVRNCPGRGIGISASDVIVRNCLVENTHDAGLVAFGGEQGKAGIRNVVIEGNVFRKITRKGLFPGSKGGGGGVNLVRVIASFFRNNTISDCGSEGLNVDKGSIGNLIVGNLIEDTNHVGLYFNHSIDNHARGNVLVHHCAPQYEGGRGGWPCAIAFGDEREAPAGYEPGRGNTVSGNLVVGWGKFLQVRNNLKNPGGYDTQLLDSIIFGNTFVCGDKTESGITIDGNEYGREHRNSVFVNNVIYLKQGTTGAMTGGGVDFHHNAWLVQPPVNMRGEGDYYGDPLLVNPEAPLVPFDPSNYLPLPESPLVGAGVNGTTIGFASPEPDEPEPDDEAFDRLRTHLDNLDAHLGRISDETAAARQEAAAVRLVIGELYDGF